MPQPHLILTLRRTGGTSLMTFLAKASPFPTVQHEPFNPDRVWGATTRAFRKGDDAAALAAAVAQHLEKRPNIKHCIEIVPMRLTRALIEACHARDYGILLLTRRDEARRLVSLFLAMATGAWGPEAAARVYPEIVAGRQRPAPVEPGDARRRAEQDAAALGQVLSILRHRRITHDWLVYEELYRGDEPVEAQALRIARKLGIEITDDDPRLRAFAERGGQDSARIEDHVPGIAELRALLADKIAV